MRIYNNIFFEAFFRKVNKYGGFRAFYILKHW